MVNPFEKRATEYLRDDETFLSVVTPAPLMNLFKKHAQNDSLYDRLALIVGAPGSGKTTHARLFQYTTLTTLLRNRGIQNYKSLVDALTDCGAIAKGRPLVMGARIPLESEYRDFWEFPYPNDTKFGLMTALLQARTVLIWLRNLQSAGHLLKDISISPRPDAQAALQAIGGETAVKLGERAREVERVIYSISAALIPPALAELEGIATAPYRPFDVIDGFQVATRENTMSLRPLVILDDAHSLHPQQFDALKSWLSQREIRVGRWVQTRLEALNAEDVLRVPKSTSGEKPSREIVEIWMQSPVERGEERKAFRKIARDMTSRYLGQMDVLRRRQIHRLADVLSVEEPVLTKTKLSDLENRVDATQDTCSVTMTRRKTIEEEVSKYLATNPTAGRDLHLSMVSILMHRYAKRTPQMGLFEGDAEDFEPSKPLRADSDVLDGARIHLLHHYNRPYYFGMDALCDAASENAEQLLQLSAILVDQIETNCIRRKPPSLTAREQHRLLRTRASKMIGEWDFPLFPSVKSVCEALATACIDKSLEPNAPLGGGATGIGIPQDEYERIPREHPTLARILKFGAAYNAFALVPNRSVKNKNWCLIDLGGTYRLKKRLTFRYGGFIEKTVDDLLGVLEGKAL